MKNSKLLKILAVITLSVMLIFTLASCGFGGGNSVASDASGDHATLHWEYKKEGQVMTITGTGEMASFESADAVAWKSVVSSVKKVVISEGVTSVCDYAFYNMTALTEANIPASVKSIGKLSFAFTPALENVSIANGLETVGYGAFEASGIKTLELPASVKNISDRAFIYCDDLNSLVGYGVANVGKEAFAHCESLTTLMLPAGVVYGEEAFKEAKIGADAVTPADKEMHKVTVSYVGEGDKIPEAVEKLCGVGEEYKIVTPTVEGLTADKAEVSGVMGNEDVTVVVTYTKTVVETEPPAETEAVADAPADDGKLEPWTIVALVATVLIIIGIIVATVIFIVREKKNDERKSTKKGKDEKKGKK